MFCSSTCFSLSNCQENMSMAFQKGGVSKGVTYWRSVIAYSRTTVSPQCKGFAKRHYKNTQDCSSVICIHLKAQERIRPYTLFIFLGKVSCRKCPLRGSPQFHSPQGAHTLTGCASGQCAVARQSPGQVPSASQCY